ncbi:hypothetical protein SAMN04488512_12429 [Sulfitobacter litoralis]|uniref:Uncharacterized protein n=1 Tax=Sulfitobacter litoralis TaxID=335975 RepID=A0ABY0SV75_9RHOB|nr:hypothetical protein SAMN04488512_12429 [Sulfitobacter litoralis]
MRCCEWPALKPREISSRSDCVRDPGRRRLIAGAMPPLATTMVKTEAACLPKARPMSLSDSPFFQRVQSSNFCSADKPGRPVRGIAQSFQGRAKYTLLR